MKLPRWFHRFGSPPYVYNLADAIAPWLGWAALVGIAVGAYWGLFVAPPDFRQGEVYRIIYIHPQTAYVGMMAYTLMAVSAGIGFIWRIKLAHAVAVSAAPIGASFTFCALVTGAIWGRPTWGTYWVWDARLTSELVLLFLYLGVMGLYSAIDEPRKAARAACLLALVGAVNLPIIHYSVKWWNTLHQGSSISLTGGSSIDASMLWPLLIMAIAVKFYYAANLLTRARVRLLQQDLRKGWVQDVVKEGQT